MLLNSCVHAKPWGADWCCLIIICYLIWLFLFFSFFFFKQNIYTSWPWFVVGIIYCPLMKKNVSSYGTNLCWAEWMWNRKICFFEEEVAAEFWRALFVVICFLVVFRVFVSLFSGVGGGDHNWQYWFYNWLPSPDTSPQSHFYKQIWRVRLYIYVKQCAIWWYVVINLREILSFDSFESYLFLLLLYVVTVLCSVCFFWMCYKFHHTIR